MKRRTWSLEDVQAWFTGRVPDGWFISAPEVTVDRDEILVVGRLSEPTLEGESGGDAREVAGLARIDGFREDTRSQRMRIADDAERLWARKISWGAACGETTQQFT